MRGLLLKFTITLSAAFLSGPILCAQEAASAAWNRFQVQSALAVEAAQRTQGELAPAESGVPDLLFQDLFEPVIGDRGPEFTERVRHLDGKRVRLVGFMVRELRRVPGVFMLAPWPTRIESDGFCLYEDYPPATLHVLLPASADTVTPPFRPGRIELYGVLSLRPETTPDGRNCVASLRIDETQLSRLMPTLNP